VSMRGGRGRHREAARGEGGLEPRWRSQAVGARVLRSCVCEHVRGSWCRGNGGGHRGRASAADEAGGKPGAAGGGDGIAGARRGNESECERMRRGEDSGKGLTPASRAEWAGLLGQVGQVQPRFSKLTK
jgi:hypothetical protein